MGPISAAPVRVHTGDGDCLNVRPVPGTQFKTDVRFCVPEGHLLWLYGDAVSVDGETWRYALGTGWVATRYTKPAQLLGGSSLAPFKAIVVSDGLGSGPQTALGRIDATGTVTPLPALDYVAQGIGARPPRLAPGGEWAAYTNWGAAPKLVVVHLPDGRLQEYPGSGDVSWSADGRLLVQTGNCNSGCHYKFGWLDPAEGVIHPLGAPEGDGGSAAWAPNSRSVFYAPGGKSLQQLWLNGSVETILEPLTDGSYLGELTVSPDGSSILSGSSVGVLRVIDLKTHTVREFPRAKQLPVGGRCGGSTGKLSAWLDPTHLIYHESYAEKGNNGITVGNLADGSRRIIPFWSINELEVLDSGLVAFTTYEYTQTAAFPLSWLLDTKTGEARPAAVGAAAAWVK